MIDFYSIRGFADARWMEVPDNEVYDICMKVSENFHLPVYQTGIDMDWYRDAFHSFALDLAFKNKSYQDM